MAKKQIKRFNIISHQEKKNQKHNKMPLHAY